VLHLMEKREGEVVEGRSAYILRCLRGQIPFFRAPDSAQRFLGVTVGLVKAFLKKSSASHSKKISGLMELRRIVSYQLFSFRFFWYHVAG